MYEIKKDILFAGHRLRPGGSYKKTSVTVHSTANSKSSAENERKWLDNPSNTREAAWHYIAGEGIVIQALPDSEEAWHSGKKEGNIKSIAIEMIETGERGSVIETCAELVADILERHMLGIKDIRKHFDWTGKSCPRILIDPNYVKDGMDWEYFLGRVEFFIKEREKVDSDRIEIIIDGKRLEVERILKEGYNFVKLRDIGEALGYNVLNRGSIPILDKKEGEGR